MDERLTEESYWNGLYSAAPVVPQSNDENRPKGFLSRFTKAAFSEWNFWHVLLPRYLAVDPNRKVLEVGSAPGGNLIQFKNKFQYQPFGVEYTKNGADSNRETFAIHGISPKQVIEADFFSESFHHDFREKFDVVFSWGFIEHFTDVDEVIEKHMALLKPGGQLVVSIPNLRGFNYYTLSKYLPKVIPLHNLTIMNLPVYRKLFARPDLTSQYCGYHGGIHLLMAAVDEAPMSKAMLKLFRSSQVVANMMQSVTGPLDSRWTSPFLLYVGRKAQA